MERRRELIDFASDLAGPDHGLASANLATGFLDDLNNFFGHFTLQGPMGQRYLFFG